MSGVPAPRGWQAMTFADVVVQGEDAIVGGPFGSSLTTADYVDAGVPVIRGSNLAGEECRFIDDGFVYVSAQKAEELTRNTARPGDMIFTQRGTLGQVAVIPRVARFNRYIVSQSQMRVRVREDQFLPRFLYWYYRSPVAIRYLESRTLATGVPHINLGILKEFPVMAPDLPEQRRIAAILDEADALRRKRREALALLDDLLRATFLDMFGDPVTNPRGWPVSALAQTFEVPPRIGTTRPATDGGAVRVVRVGEIGGPNVALHRCGMVSLPAEELERCRTVSGDFLLARAIGSEDLLGKGSVMQSVAEPVVFDSHVMRLRFAPSLMEPAFFQHWMLSPGGRQQFLRRAGRTAIQFNVNAEQIAAVEIYRPPIAYQREFKELAQAATAQRKALDSNSIQFEHLFSCLLHRAFSGAL